MPRTCRTLLALLILAIQTQPAITRRGPHPSRPSGAVGIQIRNVDFRMGLGVVLQIRTLRGRLDPTSRARPVTLDDPKSFTLEADSGVAVISTDSLTHLLNSYVFAYEGAPLKNISVSVKDGRLVQKGTMHKGVDLPFELEGSLSATEDGAIRLHADKLKSEHIPVKGLLHLFGEDLSKLINVSEARGVRVEGDDIILYPSRMMPPPHIHGRITDVRVEGDAIVQVFGGGPSEAPLRPPARAANYIYHRGGILRFGKLTMSDADLELIDNDPSTPFDFSLENYNRQLVAGYSRNTPSHGLIVRIPDYVRVEKTAPR
jgi:hypothetical protein